MKNNNNVNENFQRFLVYRLMFEKFDLFSKILLFP